jgi:hypothetical protein
VCLDDTLWATSPSAQSPVGPSPFGLRARLGCLLGRGDYTDISGQKDDVKEAARHKDCGMGNRRWPSKGRSKRWRAYGRNSGGI